MKSTKNQKHMRKTKRRIKNRKTGKNVQRRQRTVKYGGKYSSLGDSSSNSSHAKFNKEWFKQIRKDKRSESVQHGKVVWTFPDEEIDTPDTLSLLVADTYVDEEKRITDKTTKENNLFSIEPTEQNPLTNPEMVTLFTIYLLTKDIIKERKYVMFREKLNSMSTKPFLKRIMGNGSRFTEWNKLYKSHKLLNPGDTVLDWFKTTMSGDANYLCTVIKKGFDNESIEAARDRSRRNSHADAAAADTTDALVEAGFIG